MRALVAFGLLVLSGCSAFGDDLDPVDGVVAVSLGEGIADGPAVLLRTEAYPCGARLVVSSRDIEGGVRVTVDGVASGSGPCNEDGRVPLYAVVDLPMPNPTTDVEVRHRGATDLYQYACGFAGCSFAAVRTSTTRLAAP